MPADLEKPDVVGVAEVAEICGVEVPRVWRWRQAHRLPEPAADLGATGVWERDIIERFARGEEVSNGRKLKLMGIKEAADYLGVDKSQIGRWRRAGAFPAPCLDRYDEKTEPTGLRAGPLWWEKQIRAFKQVRDGRSRRRAS